MNFASGFRKVQIFCLRTCPDQLLYLDVLREPPAWRGSKKSHCHEFRKLNFNKSVYVVNGSATLLRTIYSFQFAIIFYKVRYSSWAPTVSLPLRENWQKTFKYRGFCKTLLAGCLESTGKGLLWKRKDLSINHFQVFHWEKNHRYSFFGNFFGRFTLRVAACWFNTLPCGHFMKTHLLRSRLTKMGNSDFMVMLCLLAADRSCERGIGAPAQRWGWGQG